MQQRKSTFSILFFIKRKKLLKNGDAPVYMRVTVDGRFLEASLKRGVNPAQAVIPVHLLKGEVV